MERHRRGRPRHPDVLTPAEWRVLEALRDGGTNAEIGVRLGIGAETVKYHIANMLAKLELRDRRALASWRPEERRRRLGAWFTVPAALWSVARPIAWVGAGTAAVAGVVVGVIAVVALVAVALVVAGGDGDPPLAVAPSETQTPESTSTPAPSPTVQPSPTPSPTPTAPPATATPSPSPSPTSSPTPAAPTSTPPPTPTPAPTSTPAPTATPSPVVAPLPTREEIGIREVDASDQEVAAWASPTRYDAGADVPWGAGVVLLDIETGAVEAWLEGSEVSPADDAPHAVSPSHRFLIWPERLYDRESDRWYVWDQSRIRLDRTWGAGSDERLLFHIVGSGDDVLLDSAMQPVTRIAIPAGERFTSPTGGYILVRGCEGCEPGDRFHLVDLDDETSPTTYTWTLPWRTFRRGVPYDIQPLDDLVAIVGATDPDTCRVARYNLGGALLSDVEIACQHEGRIEQGGDYSPRMSPDGGMVVAEARWIARSNDVILAIFSATTGSEILRVKSIWPGRYGADAGWRAIHLDDIWLADSSGIVVMTPSGPRIVTLDGEWEWAPGRASAVDADLFYSVFDSLPAVVDRIGKVLASVSFGSAAPPLGTYFRSGPRGVCYLGTRAHWGLSADTVRVRRAGGCAPEGPAIQVGGLGIPLAPVIEQGPFNQHLRIEVVVDTCVNLRNEPAIDAPILTCLPDATVVNMEASPRRGAIAPEWMHVRTDDGVEGWAYADYLRWHSDGVRLEE